MNQYLDTTYFSLFIIIKLKLCGCGSAIFLMGCRKNERFSVDLTKVVHRHIPRIVSDFDRGQSFP